MTFDRGDLATPSLQCRVMAVRADTVFRVSALIGCGIVALPVIARRLAANPAPRDGVGGVGGVDGLSGAGAFDPRLALAGVVALLAASFGAAFWMHTRDRAPRLARWVTAVLLAIQCAITLTVSDFAFLLAAQAPFVFPAGGAFLWLAGQLLGFATLVIVLARAGAAVAIPEVAGLASAVAIPVTIAYLAGWQVFAFSVGYLAARERRLRREHEQRAHELMATQQLLAESTRVAERTRIAHDLHDTIGHSLTVLAVHLERARHQTDGEAAEAVDTAHTIARSLLGDVREVVHAAVDDRGIDLRGALVTLCASTPPPVIELSLPVELRVEEPAAAQVVFRCVQEAVTNALRHANAQHLWIRVSQTDSGIDVQIADDGRGADVVRFGHGLDALRERVVAVNGRVDVDTALGGGFRVHAWIPHASVSS